jgi:hypothetical protein
MDAFERQQRAYEQGERAYHADKPREKNPKRGELEREAWFAGYDRAKELDESNDFDA